MPKKLSLQNAKKQVVEYMIYIITMVITVALLLSFNMIIFSEEIAVIINEKSILPLILITVSVLVVLVISALVKHITVFMVRKRSREFGLYMLLGVENNDIAKRRRAFLEKSNKNNVRRIQHKQCAKNRKTSPAPSGFDRGEGCFLLFSSAFIGFML